MKIVRRKSHNEAERKKRGLFVYSVSLVLGLSSLVYLVYALSSLILPIITGVFLAYVFRPLMNAKGISKIPKPLRAIGVLTSLVAFIAFLSTTVAKQIPGDEDTLVLQVRAQYKLNAKYEQIMGLGEDEKKGNFLYQLLGKELNPMMKSINSSLHLEPEEEKRIEYMSSKFNYVDPIPDKYYQYFLANKSRKEAAKQAEIEKEAEKTSFAATNPELETPLEKSESESSLLATIAQTFSHWLVAPLLFIFLLFDQGQILKWFIGLVPNRYFELTLTVVNQVDLAIGKYLRGTLMQCSLVGLSLSIGLFLVGVNLNMAILIGTLAGLANAIPFLGPFLGLIAGLGYALVAEDISPILPFLDPEHIFLAVLVVVGIAQLLDNAVFQPVVLGNAVNLHPIVVVVGVLGASIIFGFAGMLLAIPAIVVAKVIIGTTLKELKAYQII